MNINEFFKSLTIFNLVESFFSDNEYTKVVCNYERRVVLKARPEGEGGIKEDNPLRLE